MKILSIRFKNLNSLAGEWEIDLQDPAFTSSGIFAITGPTGSGKTTILDAICLALYGQTPRLEKISAGTNEIMTRQTAECYAEVTFESSRGHFMCNWRQKRARGRPDGKLQPPEHEIVDASTHQVLEHKIRDVSARVRDVTGMDFNQFTRSVLLAQGGFSAFLEAKPDDRAPILEQITGTGIYSRISIKVHERTGEEREQLRILQEQAGAIQVLNADEERTLIASKEDNETSAVGIANRVRILQEQIELLSRVEGLRNDISRLQVEEENLADKRKKASYELRRLEKGKKAAVFEPDWKTLSGMEKKEKEDQAQLAGLHRTEETTKAECNAAESDLLIAETTFRRLQQEMEEQRPVISRVRELDGKLSLLRAESGRLTSDIETLEKKRTEYESDLHSLKEQQEQYGAEREQAAVYIREHKEDDFLIKEYSGLHTRIETCIEHQKNIIRINKALQETSESLEKARTEHEQKKKRLAEHKTDLDKIQENITGLESQVSTILSGFSLSGIRERQNTLKNTWDRLNNLFEVVSFVQKNRERFISLVDQADILTSSLSEQERVKTEQSTRYNRQEELVAVLENNLHLAARVRDLDEERARLISGKPCPLCGSLDHPYTTGKVPNTDAAASHLENEKRILKEIEHGISMTSIAIGTISHDISINRQEQNAVSILIDEAEKEWISGAESAGVSIDADDRLKEIMTLREGIQEELAQVSNQVCRYETCELELKAEKEKQSLEKDHHNQLSKEEHEKEFACIALLREYNHYNDDKLTTSEKITADLTSMKEILSKLGFPDPDPQKLLQIDTTLKDRRDQYQNYDARYREIGSRMEKISAGIDTAQNLLKNLADDITLTSKERDEIQDERVVNEQEREKVFGNKNPGREEERMNLALKEAEQKRENLRRICEEKRREWSTLTGTIQSLTGTLKTLRDEIQEKKSLFISDIRSDFGEIQSFQESLLPPDELTRLESLSAALIREETALSALLRDKQDTLCEEEEKVHCSEPLDRLQHAYLEAKNNLEIIQDAIAVARHRLEENQARKAMFSEKNEETERQKKELFTWERLHSLIGSADGKKYRVFAQGLTFQLLILHANRHLEQMTDRYILRPDLDTPLDLAVIDTWQAGEIRSVRNLSGGESFIVSLALALGLSGMASKNVRVDSLFLDEGFGTLDDDALDTALGALSGLYQQGKLIGIISHVPVIRERISTQIRVEKRNSGRSILSAPGCRKI